MGGHKILFLKLYLLRLNPNVQNFLPYLCKGIKKKAFDNK